MNKPYSVGMAIKYIGFCRECKNKVGKIIKVYNDCYCITLPHSKCSSMICGSFVCNQSDIELLVKKNQQLLFDFMEQDDPRVSQRV